MQLRRQRQRQQLGLEDCDAAYGLEAAVDGVIAVDGSRKVHGQIDAGARRHAGPAGPAEAAWWARLTLLLEPAVGVIVVSI